MRRRLGALACAVALLSVAACSCGSDAGGRSASRGSGGSGALPGAPTTVGLPVASSVLSDLPGSGALSDLPSAGAPTDDELRFEEPPSIPDPPTTAPTTTSTPPSTKVLPSTTRPVPTTTTTTIVVPEPIPSDVLFVTGSSDLTPKAPPYLRKLLDSIVAKYPRRNVRIIFIGHTDSRGSEKANLELSQRRAAVVRDWFARNGYPAGLMRSLGAGESRLAVTPDTGPDGRCLTDNACQANRRVQIVLAR